MNKLIKIFSIVLLAIITLTFPACEDMLDTESGRILYEDDNKLDSPNDTVFSILGILSKVQNLSDRYVLLGELRGDLMDVTEYTNADLREINNLVDIRPDNPYLKVEDYYSIINNCNYFIHHVDTTIRSQGKPLMLKEYAMAKTIRAWTYMQLALNFGSVPFYLEPITKLDESEKEYPRKNIKEMSTILIDDLNPCTDYGIPGYSNIETGWGEISTEYFMFPINWVLGDLYMWRGENEMDFIRAADCYARLIFNKKYVIHSQYQRIRWSSSSFLNYIDGWSGGIHSMSENAGEITTMIPMADNPNNGTIGSVYYFAKGRTTSGTVTSAQKTALQITCSNRAIQFWEDQLYAYVPVNGKVATMTTGDLREQGSFYSSQYNNVSFINKYYPYYITIFRKGLLYLRYAEAVNHANKPGLAFAVLKYGLNATNLANGSIVPRHEAIDAEGRYYFEIFKNAMFDENKGIHSRGCGESEYNNSYIIPVGTDSIAFVDNAILTELALETAFEGNRFHDLMRFSMRNNDNSILANTIALKHVNNWSQIMSFLMNEKNWYLPLPDNKKETE